jgi:DHA1 family multidrug resistance protein-like MFS transporter
MRFLQGVFSGYINNAIAMIAGETPHSRSGWVMAAMSTAGVAGNLVGPLLGGALSGAFGYRIPFFITGGLMFIVFLSTWLLTVEHFKPIQKAAMKPLGKIIHELTNPRLIFVMFLTTMIVTASTMSISPIISLYVRSLMHNHGNVAFVAGVVAAAPGLGTLIAASKVGHKMDQIGPERILRIGLTVAVVLFVPMTFTHSPWSLAFWRFLLGLANAALMPAAQTVLTLDVPTEAFGRIFSLNQSFQAGGAVLGSLLGSTISGLSSYQMVFAVTGLTLLVNLILVWSVRIKKRA